MDRGPYRYLRHPNYVAVAAEIAAFPMVVGAWRTATGFSLANALVLRHRIGVEDEARRAASPMSRDVGCRRRSCRAWMNHRS